MLESFVDAGITEMSDTKPDDPYRKMYEFLFQASLVDYTTSPAAADKSSGTASSSPVRSGAPRGRGRREQGQGQGTEERRQVQLADAGDFFSELSKKMKATGAP